MEKEPSLMSGKKKAVNNEASFIENIEDVSIANRSYVSENAESRSKRIKELERIIKENSDQYEKVKRMQESYDHLPYEALTDEDQETISIPMEDLKQELESLKEKNKKEMPSIRERLRKVAAFFSI